MDDWQENVFTTRHMHNRTGRGGNGRSHAFDVRKTFGSYTCKCTSWSNIAEDIGIHQEASLNLLRLSSNQEAVVGELSLPGVLTATIILAASRKSLARTVEGFDFVGMEHDSDNEENENEDEDEDDEEEEEEEEEEIDRFERFEKNSFRAPKFWLQWIGTVQRGDSSTTNETAPAEGQTQTTELGYIVFSGNDCRKFKGTINSKKLEWKDVAISGRKVASKNESDIPVRWGVNGPQI